MKRSMAFKGVVVALSALAALVLLAALPGDAKDITAPAFMSMYQNTVAGNDNTLYVLSSFNNTIQAVGPDGGLKWEFRIPRQWNLSYNFDIGLKPDNVTAMYVNGYLAAASSDGVIYVYLVPAVRGGIMDSRVNGKLVAISGGKELWELPLESRAYNSVDFAAFRDPNHYSDASIFAGGDRVYVFHEYNETIIDENGTVLWNIKDVADPVAVDEEGFVYAVGSADPQYNFFGQEHREPSAVMDAYYPDGRLYWERSAAGPLVRQSTADIPLYDNGAIFAPMSNGIMALDRNGNTKWTKTYGTGELKFDPGDSAKRAALRIYGFMPFDSRGNVYLQYVSDPDVPIGASFSNFPMYLIAIGPDGNEISRSNIPAYRYEAAGEGIGYATRYTTGNTPGRPYTPANVTDLSPQSLYAFDLLSGREIWNHTFAPDNVTAEAVDRGEAYRAFNYNSSGQLDPGCIPDTSPLSSSGGLSILPGAGVVYVRYQGINYQNPNAFSQPMRAYVDEIYAFDLNGTLLWQKPLPLNSQFWVMQDSTAPRNNTTAPQNSTILYRTPDGRFGVIGAGVAGGLTLTAFLYLFLRFFCVGAVARAKARFSNNDNRRRIMDFIVRSPGSTLYEIARGTGLNLGTVKYHMLILGMNHKTVSSRMDGKYVRYFTNSGTFSREDQLVVSLMRRETMGKVIGLISSKPGISNAGIARELDIQESVASRCVKELAEKGVIASDGAEVRRTYRVSDGYAGHVDRAIKSLGAAQFVN